MQHKYSNYSQNIQKKDIFIDISPTLHTLKEKKIVLSKNKNIPIYIYKKLKNSVRLTEEEYRLLNYFTFVTRAVHRVSTIRNHNKVPSLSLWKETEAMVNA